MSEFDKALEALVERVVRRVLAEGKPDAVPELVTVAEYARARSISESTVRQAIAEHRLAVVRIGRAVRVPATAEIGRRKPANDVTDRARMVLLRGGKVR